MAEATSRAISEESKSDETLDIRAKVLSALKRGDIILALAVVAVLVILIMPMPKWMLDISLAFSITFSVLILMTALFLSLIHISEPTRPY